MVPTSIVVKGLYRIQILDFSKAFDRVPHSLLMQKLSSIEDMDDYLVNRIYDFLYDRTQHAVLNRTRSGSKPVTYGVPQGSVLGPTLFLLYINDLPETVGCSVSLFADDTHIFQVVNNATEENRFQSNVNALLQSWATKRGMEFNSSVIPKYTFGDQTLDHVEETK